MRASVAVSLFAIGLAQAGYAPPAPSCQKDACYNSLVDDCNIDIAEEFCPEFTGGKIPTEFPEEFECESLEAVASACACFLQPEPTNKPEPTSKTTTPVPSGSASATTKGPKWSTSTIYETQTHTFTECPPEETDCPLRTKTDGGHYVVTKTTAVSTTICPVTDDEPKPTAKPSCNGEDCQGPKPKPTKGGDDGCNGEDCPKPKPTKGGDDGCNGEDCPKPKPTAKPSCIGEECNNAPRPTVPVPTGPVPSRPVTAGASTVAGGLLAVFAGVAAALF